MHDVDVESRVKALALSWARAESGLPHRGWTGETPFWKSTCMCDFSVLACVSPLFGICTHVTPFSKVMRVLDSAVWHHV